MEARLELVTAIGPDRVNPERKLFDHGVDEVDRVLLIVPPVDRQRSDLGGMIDASLWLAACSLAILSFEFQKRTVDLDVVTRHLLGDSSGFVSCHEPYTVAPTCDDGRQVNRSERPLLPRRAGSSHGRAAPHACVRHITWPLDSPVEKDSKRGQ